MIDVDIGVEECVAAGRTRAQRARSQDRWTAARPGILSAGRTGLSARAAHARVVEGFQRARCGMSSGPTRVVVGPRGGIYVVVRWR